MRRANAVALVAVAALLVAAAPAPAATLPLGAGSQLDPAASDGALAYTQRDGHGVRVVIDAPRPERRRPRAGASTPSLDGPLVAVHQGNAVRVLRWADGSELARVDGAIRPALRNGILAFERRRGRAAAARDPAPEGRPADAHRLGHQRRSSAGPRCAAAASPGRSPGAASRRCTPRASTGARAGSWCARASGVLGAPALGTRWLAYTETRASGAQLLARSPDAGPLTTTLLRLHGTRSALWTTALVGRTAYVTRWSTRTGVARILRLRF